MPLQKKTTRFLLVFFLSVSENGNGAAPYSFSFFPFLIFPGGFSESQLHIDPARDVLPNVGTNWRLVGWLVSLNSEVTKVSLKTLH